MIVRRVTGLDITTITIPQNVTHATELAKKELEKNNMNVANILMTWGKPAGEQAWVLEGIKFIYQGSFWHILVGKKAYEVSDIVAGQVAYALTVDGDIDIIQESLEDDEIVPDPEPMVEPIMSEREEGEAEYRANYVKYLFQKNTKPYQYAGSGMYNFD